MKKTILGFALTGICLFISAQDETVNGRLRINSGADVGAGQTPALLIGNRTGLHIGIDGNEIGAFNNNNNAVLYLNGSNSNTNTIINGDGTGRVGIGTGNPSATLHINSSRDVGRGQNPAFLIGSRTAGHIAIDNNEIGAFYNNSNAVLYLNGSQSTSNTIINGDGPGNVGIGTSNPNGWRLAVNGKIRAKEVKVETDWADFVFLENYTLPTLFEVENYISENGHLKDIPSADEVKENGIFVGEMNSKLLQKIEELTLYTIQQQKEIERLKLLEEKLLKIEMLIEAKSDLLEEE
ncbi:hypothetical protein MHTCC0001_08820 [Flavobacteriaceae bacterium MHTCC 0001]